MADAPRMTLKTARELLGVSPAAAPGDLRRAFREAAKQAHPDRAGGAAERFREVVDAYHHLQAFAGAQRAPIVQPPAVREPAATPVLSIPPLVAFAGGTADHRLPDGRVLRLQLPAGLRTGDTVRAGATELPVVVCARTGCCCAATTCGSPCRCRRAPSPRAGASRWTPRWAGASSG